MSWDQVPLGYCVTEVKEKNTGGREDNLLSLSYGNIVRRDITTADGLLPESFDSYNVINPGDTVLRLTDLQNDQRSLRVGLVVEAGIITSAYVTVRPNKVMHPQFLNYFLKHLDFRKDFYALGAGVRQSLKFEELRSVKVPVPALAEQKAIADYLDIETDRIDGLITKKLQIIELIDERRSAFVGRAVTVGVTAGPTTQTGNEFAPVVRIGWTLQRLRHVVEEIVDTAHKTAPVVDDGEYLVVRTANVKAGELVLDGARYTDEDGWREWTARGVPSVGDVIFTREAPAGEACLVPEGSALCIGQRTVLLRPNRSMISGEWIMHSIYSGAAQRFIEVLAKSTTVAHINMSDIPDLPIVLPPLREQEVVLALVRQEVSRISTMKEKLTRQIGLLRDYRQALITAAVTGDLELPEVAA